MDYNKIINNVNVISGGAAWIPAFLNTKKKQGKHKEKKLIVIQLNGGNDGLNTIVPYGNDLYYKLRPKLGLKKNKILTINEELGFNFALKEFRKLYDQGQLSIINAVGYPDSNRSHFRSRDIWHSASTSRQNLETGWIGRYLDERTETTGRRHHAIEVDDSLSLAMKGNIYNGLAISHPRRFYRKTHKPFVNKLLRKIEKGEHHIHNPSAAYLYKTLVETNSSANYIREKAKIKSGKIRYARNAISHQLKSIAEFIRSGVDCNIYYADMAGFDTHSKQKNVHENLLELLDKSIGRFVADLKDCDQFKNTLILIISEFGRRAAENNSLGTDHGTANNVFIIGEKFKKAGIYNNPVSLSDLDLNSDLKHSLDFKRIYASILKNWLGADDEKILLGQYETLDFI